MTLTRLATVTAFIVGAIIVGAGPAFPDPANIRIVYVSHAADSDSFWNTMKNSYRLAAKELGVTVEYRNPPTGDVAEMARLVEQASASNADGIITTMPDVDVLRGPITAAIKKGIPVITVNTGTDAQSQKLGALMHVGQPEYIAGKLAGERVKAEGGKNYLCINHYIAAQVLTDRCQGFADGIGVPMADRMIDTGLDPSSVKTKVEAYLKTHPDTDTILAEGPNAAEPTIQVIKEQHLEGKVHFVTFDLSKQIISAIQDGTLEFAIDQQPFLQGYLPVVLMTNYIRYGVIPPGDLHTGPGFVTKANIGLVAKFAGEYR